MWKSRCFFLVREDDSADDFSYRKCVDHILPLPENMKTPGYNGNGHGGRGRRVGRGGCRGGVHIIKSSLCTTNQGSLAFSQMHIV
ncbi:hypothetical protein HID58_084707 [Brassica napus]|uniref:Uncharacterized protein n=1 Tax=Brassica napus TaxID=3708 RepID=A0ABQ7XKP5_BRANA|nr:hypothetical protein HID58_084707 [Brassica napus]